MIVDFFKRQSDKLVLMAIFFRAVLYWPVFSRDFYFKFNAWRV